MEWNTLSSGTGQNGEAFSGYDYRTREREKEKPMKAKVFEAMNGSVRVVATSSKAQDVPLETALNQFLTSLDEVKKGQGVHFITQSECAVSLASGDASRYVTVTVIYE